jgi:hypothetical protein
MTYCGCGKVTNQDGRYSVVTAITLRCGLVCHAVPVWGLRYLGRNVLNL